MLLMIDQPQVRFTASHHTPQSRANAGDWGSQRLTTGPASATKAGIEAGIECRSAALGRVVGSAFNSAGSIGISWDCASHPGQRTSGG